MAKMHPFWWFKAPPISCPSGEQIINGGFETGDLTGWEGGFNIGVNGIFAHSGNYYAWLDTGNWAWQTLAEAILVECIASFTLWLKCPDPYNQPARITITYSDDTTTEIDVATSSSWTEFNLLPYLVAGKSVKTLTILCKDEPPYQTLSVDDVSLIGTG